MNVAVCILFFAWTVFAQGARVNANEENDLGVGQPKSEFLFLEQHNQDDYHTHDVEKVTAAGAEVQKIAPYFINMKKMSRMHVKPAGNMISLKCKAGGYPTPNVTWYKNNEIPRTHSGNIRYGQWSLTLEELDTDDSGNYRCVVCNSLGCINFNYTLTVVERYHNRPILTAPPKNKTVVVGSNVNFSCTFVSDLNPHIYWFRGMSNENRTVQVNLTSHNHGTLELFNVTHDSEGWYTCVAANSMGSTSDSAYLEVV